MELFDVVDAIRARRDRHVLTKPRVDQVIDAYTRGAVKDEQMAALAMAILLRGMNREEISQWTNVMIASGERMDLASLARPTADEHSTERVGDKTTLPLTPLVAVLDVTVPQLSNRGFGHIGGTLDKLESIPGWRASMPNERIYSQPDEGCGAVIYAVDTGLAPANKKLYTPRDITSTIDRIPLVASSTMSKKIAGGTGSLVLDVRVGSGVFMEDINQACELARATVGLGADADMRTFAYPADVSTPLGLTVGNALEIHEPVEVLAGGGPADVVELAYTLTREMLEMSGKTDTDVEAALKNGCAMDVWREMIEAQGDEVGVELPIDAESHIVFAQEDGVLHTLDALSVGIASWRLGAGRTVKEDPVQAGVGIEIHTKPGGPVKKGQPLLILHTDDEWKVPRALESFEGGIVIGDSALNTACVVLDEIG